MYCTQVLNVKLTSLFSLGKHDIEMDVIPGKYTIVW